MHIVRTFVSLSVASLAMAYASPVYTQTTPPSASAAPMSMGKPEAAAALDPRMKTLHEMHQKMAKATPAKRQGLMAEHMKAMQGGMAMMKEMHAMHAAPAGMGGAGMGPMGSHGSAAPMAGMADGKGMSTDMSKSHQMMSDHMAMMQMMMEMMADRMPPAAASR